MAAGVPTTGIGGLYYLLLALAIGLYKILARIRSLFRTTISRTPSCFLMRFPTLASLLSLGLIMYMNATGFRVTIPGSRTMAVPSSIWTYLGLIGAAVIAFFIVILLLFHVRANRSALYARGLHHATTPHDEKYEEDLLRTRA